MAALAGPPTAGILSLQKGLQRGVQG